jgi:transposase
LFYRTLNGAQVGDLFMSLIHTCQLCGVISFDSLVGLQRNAQEPAARPAEWMPWNYRETLARSISLHDSAEL